VLLERIHAAMGKNTNVITGYGLTEATALVSFGHVRLDAEGKIIRPKSIGKAAPGIEVRLLGDTGEEVVSGAVGEICVHGPNVMVGYYKNPEETAKAVVDGWLHTGDLGMSDDQGYLYIVDRKKDIIIRGGQNIYPADIEEVIYRHPGVSEVAVIGAVDDSLGEVPVAYVALQAGRSCRSEDIIARCKDELAYYKVPVAIHFLPELPKGPTGKVLRRGLKPQ
jgi:long-chain acyl-CoA synthetase